MPHVRNAVPLLFRRRCTLDIAATGSRSTTRVSPMPPMALARCEPAVGCCRHNKSFLSLWHIWVSEARMSKLNQGQHAVCTSENSSGQSIYDSIVGSGV